MFIQFCKSKIGHAIVTQTELFYEGSITIDQDLIEAVDIIPGERVEVLNLNNGRRFDTYVIAGGRGSGQICLNGPAARQGLMGDQIIILSYCIITPEEAKKIKTQIIHLDDSNKIKN